MAHITCIHVYFLCPFNSPPQHKQHGTVKGFLTSPESRWMLSNHAWQFWQWSVSCHCYYRASSWSLQVASQQDTKKTLNYRSQATKWYLTTRAYTLTTACNTSHCRPSPALVCSTCKCTHDNVSVMLFGLTLFFKISWNLIFLVWKWWHNIREK